MRACALCGLASVIVELSAVLRVADPLTHDGGKFAFGIGNVAHRAVQLGTAHRVAHPAEFDILFLQEIVTREFCVASERQPDPPPVPLHAQTLGKRTVIQVFAMPAAAVGEDDEETAEHEQQQENVEHVVLRGQVVVSRERDRHQRGHGIEPAHGQQHATLKVDRQPVRRAEQPLDGAGGRRDGRQSRMRIDRRGIFFRIRIELGRIGQRRAEFFGHRTIARLDLLAAAPNGLQGMQ